MSLQFLDQKLLGQYILDAWQQAFETEMDPSDGQWYTRSPNSAHGGLYGGLTDTLASALVFDESKKIFTPHQIIADTAIVDNRNGLTPTSTVTLSYAYSNSVAT